MGGIGALTWANTRPPGLREGHINRGAAFIAIGARNQPRDGHIHKGRIGSGGGAIGEGNLQRLGQQMQHIGAAKTQAAQIEAFQDVQHLQHMHAGRSGRRWQQNFITAIGATQRCAFNRGEISDIGSGDNAAHLPNAISNRAAQCTLQHARPFAHDQRECFSIFRLDQPRA